jgi:hypothetical protein
VNGFAASVPLDWLVAISRMKEIPTAFLIFVVSLRPIVTLGMAIHMHVWRYLSMFGRGGHLFFCGLWKAYAWSDERQKEKQYQRELGRHRKRFNGWRA